MVVVAVQAVVCSAWNKPKPKVIVCSRRLDDFFKGAYIKSAELKKLFDFLVYLLVDLITLSH